MAWVIQLRLIEWSCKSRIGRNWEELATTYFNVLSERLFRGTEECHETSRL